MNPTQAPPVCRHCHQHRPDHCKVTGCGRCPQVGLRDNRVVTDCPLHGQMTPLHAWRDTQWSPA